MKHQVLSSGRAIGTRRNLGGFGVFGRFGAFGGHGPLAVFAAFAFLGASCLSGLGVSLLEAAEVASPQPLSIDEFSEAGLWTAHPADGVELALGQDGVKGNPALRLDFHFEGGGYAIARRELELPLPENYAFTFRVRGVSPNNHLEFKLVDGTGENVWWHVRRNVEFSSDYQTFRIKKRKVQFAWGPKGGGEIDTVSAIEFAITAGDGGTGTLWIDDLALTPLPPPDESPLRPTAQTSSNEAAAMAALDGDSHTAWGPDVGETAPWFQLDLGREYEFGGLFLDWGSRYPRDYRIALSLDGEEWHDALLVSGSDGSRDPIFLPDSEARFVRITAQERSEDAVSSAGMEIREVELVPLEQFPDREAFFHEIAKTTRRGLYPRGVFGEQSYWTVIGPDHDAREVLVGEEGAVELWAGGPSMEPFLGLDGELLTWADARIGTSLADGFLPVPTVNWNVRDLVLEIVAFAAGEGEEGEGVVRYRVSNPGAVRRDCELHLAIRPFQVNPPSQTLNLRGGTARLSSLSLSTSGATLEGRIPLWTLPPADRVGATRFAGGDIVADHLSRGTVPASIEIDDPFGAASGSLTFALSLDPGESEDVWLRFPLMDMARDGSLLLDPQSGATPETTTLADEAAGAPVLPATDEMPTPPILTAADLERRLEETKDEWRSRLGRVRIELPPSGTRYLETMRAQIGFILVNRSGPAIQPGVRSYARSWIRDGALTSSALLRVGHPEAAREFLEWFAPHQYENGKIPCVVDRRGADPVPEHDSSGEFIYLVAETFRFTGDRELAERHWPKVLAAARYLDSLRHERLGPEYQSEEMRAFRGILPPSISHEGYSAKPMHSYWDDFFALRGFKDALFLAQELDKPEAKELRDIASDFARDLGASIQAAQELHGIDWVPGCADLGDFDATSTTIALTPVGVDGIVPREDLVATFQRYLRFSQEREWKGWDAYTPYELRNVGAFVRLGWREEAHDLLEFFFRDQRPEGWRSWAEVVARQERTPRFLGDIPHTWVGSDYIRSFLDMFVAEDPDGRFATLGAGVRPDWLEGRGVFIEELPTRFGKLDLRMRRGDERSVTLWLGGNVTTPPEGWRIAPPSGNPPKSVRIDGREVSPQGQIRVDHSPAEVVFSW